MNDVKMLKHALWCTCKGHGSKDYGVRVDLYCRQFIPDGWLLDCKTIDTTKDKYRYLYLTGHCVRCGGFMLSGTSLAVNFSNDALLNLIYDAMGRYRPFAHKQEDGTYTGCLTERGQWHSRQDALSRDEKANQFISLFQEKDRAAAKLWLKNNGKGVSK